MLREHLILRFFQQIEMVITHFIWICHGAARFSSFKVFPCLSGLNFYGTRDRIQGFIHAEQLLNTTESFPQIQNNSKGLG